LKIGRFRTTERRALGKLAQVMQKRRKGDAAGWVQREHSHSSRKVRSIPQKTSIALLASLLRHFYTKIVNRRLSY
jgi:hypothetical protein